MKFTVFGGHAKLGCGCNGFMPLHHQPARTLRSSTQLLLYQPATRINFQSKAFSITAPAVWNPLSPVTTSSANVFLVRWVLMMVHVKNYETVSTGRAKKK